MAADDGDQPVRLLPFPGRSADLQVPPLLVAAVEALLFASPGPLRLQELQDALPDAERDEILGALSLIAERTAGEDRGVELVEVDRGWQLRSDRRFAAEVARLRDTPPVRLSRAALECLSIVAYEQPVTKGEIDDVRGVDSGATVRNLLQRGLIRVSGRRQVPGRPLEYRTTRAFLQLMTLSDLSDLPTLEEAEALDE
jgi:segregation and condensation protein B